MSTWRIDQIGKKPMLHDPLFIEGLPGIGNVGKVAVDFLIDELQAIKMYEITSDQFPNSVFVNEDNLIDLPKIEMYYKKRNNGARDLLLLSGDVQPVEEGSSYHFSEKILDIVSKFNIKDIVTLGGIGLQYVPKKPKIYMTGNNKKMMSEFMQKQITNQLYGVVGPIVGISGLLLGLSTRRKMRAIAFLAETYGHPMYLGVKGSKEILRVLNGKLGLGLNIGKLEKEIKEIEKEVLRRQEDMKTLPEKGMQNFKGGGEANYIG